VLGRWFLLDSRSRQRDHGLHSRSLRSVRPPLLRVFRAAFCRAQPVAPNSKRDGA